MNFILKITCKDRVGIVANLTAKLFENGCNILESSQFFQPDMGTAPEDGIGMFFMRLKFSISEAHQKSLQNSLSDFETEFHADCSLAEVDKPLQVIIMVSKFDHCLQDILYRVKTQTLPINILAVISNHPDSRADVERLDIPFYLWPVTKNNKQEQETKLDNLIETTGAELVILARYMQILSDAFSSKHFGKIINIHHSFLPAFKGAKPYHKAWERGVKHIGSTAHYVTPDLDEGPIIEQESERVTHSSAADELVRLGRDVEAKVLSRAIRLHAEGRVFINKSRTVVFQP